MENKRSFRYLTIQEHENGLQIYLNEEGIELVKELKEDGKSDSDIWYELFEDVRGNSEYIFHDDMGESGFGLTDAEGITDGYFVSDNGDGYETSYPEFAKVYWFPNYMITSPLDKMFEEGNVFFTKADESDIVESKKDFATVYNEVVEYIMADQNVDRDKAIEIINEENKETWIRDMVESEGETNSSYIAEQILNTDEGKYSDGGTVTKEEIDDFVYEYLTSREEAEETLKRRKARLSNEENERLKYLNRKSLNVGLTLTDDEEVEYNKLVHKYRGWEYSNGGGVGDFDDNQNKLYNSLFNKFLSYFKKIKYDKNSTITISLDYDEYFQNGNIRFLQNGRYKDIVIGSNPFEEYDKQEYIENAKKRIYELVYKKDLYANGGGVDDEIIIRNKNKNDWKSKFDFYLKYNNSNIGKGSLMDMAYDDTKGVDSAIPQSLVGDLDNTAFFVYDYKNNFEGELVDLREKLKFSNTKVNVTIVVNGEVLHRDKLPDELLNPTFHQALDYVFKHDEVEAFDIRPKKSKYENGGGVKKEKTKVYDVFRNGTQQGTVNANNLTEAKKKVYDMYGKDGYKVYLSEEYANGGGVNTGRSWHLDRQKRNKSESWEKPMSQRKKRYDNGGGVAKELNGYRVRIYKSGNDTSSQNVVSSKFDTIILVTDGIKGDSFSVMSNEPYIKLVKRNLFGKEVLSAEPVNFGVDNNHKMFGGTFVWSSDSRFRDDISERPIPLHDRVEVYENGGVFVFPHVNDLHNYIIESYGFLLPKEGESGYENFTYSDFAEELKSTYDIKNPRNKQVYDYLIHLGNIPMFSGKVSDMKKIEERMSTANVKFENGGGVNDKKTSKAKHEIDFLTKKGYDIDAYSTLNRDVIFGGEKIDDFIIATQGSIGKGKDTKFAIAYWYRDNEDGEMQISRDLLNEISNLFKGSSVILYTNAGVDLHSITEGKHKNIQVIKVAYGEFSGNSDEYAKGGTVESLEKELRKLQRDLNSHRLSTYTEGDESEQRKALNKEREVKLARFNEVLGLLRKKDVKYSKGGGINSGRDLLFKSKEPYEQSYKRKREFKKYGSNGNWFNDLFEEGGNVSEISKSDIQKLYEGMDIDDWGYNYNQFEEFIMLNKSIVSNMLKYNFSTKDIGDTLIGIQEKYESLPNKLISNYGYEPNKELYKLVYDNKPLVFKLLGEEVSVSKIADILNDIETKGEGGKYSKGGGINSGRDLLFKSNEPHEQKYKRKREFKKYGTNGNWFNDLFEEGGNVSYGDIKKEKERMTDELLKKCGVFFAFSNEQFLANKTPLKEGEKYVSIGGGGYMPKGNIDAFSEGMKSISKLGKNKVKENNLAETEILYELNNHECFYTGDYSDVVDMFKGTYTEEQIRDVYNKHRESNQTFKNGGGVTDVTKNILKEYIFEYKYPKHKNKPSVNQYYSVDTSKVIPIGGMSEDGFKLKFINGNESGTVITVIKALQAIRNGEIEFEQSEGYFVKIKAIKKDSFANGGGISSDIIFVSAKNIEDRDRFFESVTNLMPDHFIIKQGDLSVQLEVNPSDMSSIEQMAKTYNVEVIIDNGVEPSADYGDLISINIAEKALGRKINSWKDDVITLDGIIYRKVFLKPEYKKIK